MATPPPSSDDYNSVAINVSYERRSLFYKCEDLIKMKACHSIKFVEKAKKTYFKNENLILLTCVLHNETL